MPRPPAAVTSAAVSSIVSGRFFVAGCPATLRPEQYTVAPASPSMRAMPRPAPRVAPATTAIPVVVCQPCLRGRLQAAGPVSRPHVDHNNVPRSTTTATEK